MTKLQPSHRRCRSPVQSRQQVPAAPTPITGCIARSFGSSAHSIGSRAINAAPLSFRYCKLGSTVPHDGCSHAQSGCRELHIAHLDVFVEFCSPLDVKVKRCFTRSCEDFR